MRRHTLLVLTLSCGACAAPAAPLYKCTAPDGKISYSDQECSGRQQRSKVITTPAPAPQSASERAARLATELDRLRAADAAFRERQAERDRTEREAQAAAQAEAETRRQAALEAGARRAAEIEAQERARADAYAFCRAYPKRC